MDHKDMEAYAAWILTRPERVQVVLRKIDGWTAYRLRGDDGNYVDGLYTLESVSAPVDDEDAPCTVRMLRFDEATGLPMWEVFGLDPDKLEAIGPAIIDDGLLRVGTVQ